MILPLNYQELDILLPKRLAVEKVWTSVADKAKNALILPDGRADLILKFMLDEADKPYDITPIIAGPSADWWLSPAIPRRGFVGLRFKPGFGGHFLKVPLAEIAGRAHSGEEALALAPQLKPLCAPAQNAAELVARLEVFFEAYTAPKIPLHLNNVIDEMHLSGGRTPIEILAKNNGITVRTLHRQFLKYVGLSPKIFASVLRFHRALRLITRNRLNISQAAFEAGFSDQAHMNRDFKRHGGFTPAKIPPELVMVGLPI